MLLKTLDVFGLCVVIEQSVAPTDCSHVFSTPASHQTRPPSRGDHLGLPREVHVELRPVDFE
jgi:hypothetical protein